MLVTKKPLVFLITCLIVGLSMIIENTNGCSCSYTHPQTHFCTSHFVIKIMVKEQIPLEQETAYKVKINRKYKLSNESYDEYLADERLYTANLDSICGISLDVGETYVVSGRIYDGKPRLSLCNFKARWSEVTKRQRKGLNRLYAKGCTCNVSYTTFQRKGEALHRANGKLCPWESSPGPMDCQEKHGICVPYQGHCTWMSSRLYDQCVNKHHQDRLLQHQRLREHLL